MKRIKFFVLMGMLSIAFLLGGVVGITLYETSTKAHAEVVNVNSGERVIYESVYVDGQRYIVFTSGSSSMAVIKK